MTGFRGTSSWQKYLKWVEDNPGTATDIEKALKWISYIISAYIRRTSNTLVITELIHKAGNLITFLHDRVFEQVSRFSSNIAYSRVEYILGFLETSEVIFELAGSLAGGVGGKWAVIVAIQVLKALCRLTLLFKQRHMLPHPTIETLDRDAIIENHLASKTGSGPSRRNPPAKPAQPRSNHLPRSGRKIRSLDSAPMSNFDRTWTVPSCSTSPSSHGGENNNVLDPSSVIPNGSRFARLTTRQVLGEVTYVCQPLAHLAGLAAFGRQSWKPWTISIGVDLMSHGLYYGQMDSLSHLEQAELHRRRTNLLLYLVRSPFYDKFTKDVIFAMIMFTRRNVPFGKSISEILLAYIPHYRKIYGYLWSN